jgi:P-type E1-E2 ATPase
VTVRVEIPGNATLELEHLVLDVNGTLTDRGELLPGVAERLATLDAVLDLHLLSADTFGTLASIADELKVSAEYASSGAEKLDLLEQLEPACCVVVGNGANDVAVLRAAALGIAVVGPEGASSEALIAADVVCGSILDAFDLLLDERALRATLRR